MSWWKESQRHAQARKGISTVQRSQSRGMANQDVIKYKLNNNIQKNITELDRKLRSICNIKSNKLLEKKIKEAEILYDRLGKKIENHNRTYGGFPDWIKHDWVNNEKFGKNGKVEKTLNNLKDSDPKNMKKHQNELFNTIKFSTEQRR